MLVSLVVLGAAVLTQQLSAYGDNPFLARNPHSQAEIPVSAAALATSTPVWEPVIRVIDGDTIVVMHQGATTTVRLIGVDTPEVVDPRKPVQCFGREASAQTKLLLTGQSVHLEFDPSQGVLDKYGRTLAYVWAPLNSDPQGFLVDEYLISEGYGHEYTYDVPYKYQAEFNAAQAEAKQQQKGLWAPGVCGK